MKRTLARLVLLAALAALHLHHPAAAEPAAEDEQAGSTWVTYGSRCRTDDRTKACVEVQEERTTGAVRARVLVAPKPGHAVTPRTLVWLRATHARDEVFCAEGCAPLRKSWLSEWYDAPAPGRSAVRFEYWASDAGFTARSWVAAGRPQRSVVPDATRTAGPVIRIRSSAVHRIDRLPPGRSMR